MKESGIESSLLKKRNEHVIEAFLGGAFVMKCCACGFVWKSFGVWYGLGLSLMRSYCKSPFQEEIGFGLQWWREKEDRTDLPIEWMWVNSKLELRRFTMIMSTLLNFVVWVGMTMRNVLVELLCYFNSCCITDSKSSLKEWFHWSETHQTKSSNECHHHKQIHICDTSITVSSSLTRFDYVVNHPPHMLLLPTNSLIPSSNEWIHLHLFMFEFKLWG